MRMHGYNIYHSVQDGEAQLELEVRSNDSDVHHSRTRNHRHLHQVMVPTFLQQRTNTSQTLLYTPYYSLS